MYVDKERVTHTQSLPGGSSGKGSSCQRGDTVDTGLIPGSGRSLEEGNGNSLQYSSLENSMGRRV